MQPLAEHPFTTSTPSNAYRPCSCLLQGTMPPPKASLGLLSHSLVLVLVLVFSLDRRSQLAKRLARQRDGLKPSPPDSRRHL